MTDMTDWNKLTPFTQGYINGLIDNLLIERETDSKGQTLRERWAEFFDLAPETLAQVVEDCANAYHLCPGVSDDGDRRAGRGFWNVRQSNAIARRFPALTVCINDDGKVRFA